MGKLLKLVFSRGFTIGILITVQVIITVIILSALTMISGYIYALFYMLSLLFILYLFSSDQIIEYKLVWSFVIMLFPLLGGVFYLLWGKRSTDWRALRSLKTIYKDTQVLFDKSNDDMQSLKSEDKSMSCITNYLNSMAHSGLYKGCKAEYYSCGEKFFEPFLEALRSAEKFICMEYFIVEEGKMWDTTLEILKEKVKQGVEVYFMYDDAGSIAKVPNHYDRYLCSLGIKAVKFNKLHARMYTLMNYRDHRKITVVDGKVAFTGGLNLADEYINATHPFGYWKDTAVRVEGEGVWEYTIMFFQLWCFASHENIDINKYRNDHKTDGQGYTQLFGDDPLDEINVSEDTYINIITRAKKYIYISTPYLIIDNRMIGALQAAARSGIDVRIMTPGVPDKKIVFYVTQSYYKSLIKAGIKIYEYQPGFLHAKSIVSDDDIAVVGTVNMDYRSLYLHFECAATFYKSNIPFDVKKDMDESFPKCKEISLDDVKNTFWFKRLLQAIFRVFAPLM